MPSAAAAACARSIEREAIAVTTEDGERMMPGVTFFMPISAVERMPQRTLPPRMSAMSVLLRSTLHQLWPGRRSLGNHRGAAIEVAAGRAATLSCKAAAATRFGGVGGAGYQRSGTS